MNKLLLVLPALMVSLGHAFGFGVYNGPHAESTPNIPSGGHGHRTRARAPNDGRWHMKHHRSRG